MGIQLRLKQELRRGIQQVYGCWQRCLVPFRLPREREKLAAINALERVHESQLPEGFQHGVEKLVLFSHYHPRGWLQRCIRRELADLRARGWPVLLLTGSLDSDALSWCDKNGIGWLRRHNEGRDFGAFQDGWLWLQHRHFGSALEQLILLNDSVYPVVDLEATSWPSFVDYQGEEVLGFSDCFQNAYHLQSYGLHLPKAVIQQPWWDSFWRAYRGWGGMSVAIREGEIGLSQLLLNQGIALRALHPVSQLRGQIASRELLEKLQHYCSEPAAVWIQQQLLSTGLSSLNFYSTAHYWAIPLLMDGCPFIKRWLLESNEKQMLDPLLLAGGKAGLVDPQELQDYLRPPVIGFAN
ncbi:MULTISPECIES: hypothetical protein [unclassified Synechococcus]|uniref:hypothetical protein n=1 Tax=unclassified Synechococcus TaxID=2626047 RepID=UPI0039B0FE17